MGPEMRLDKKTIRALSMVSGLGFSIAVCLGGSILAGYWLDERLHTRHLMVIVGIFAGLFGSSAIIYRLAAPRKRGGGSDKDELKR
jgi:uncharacterized membrane protein YedE/YeeE